MRILIIGGTGLISTAITRQLLARGDDVTLYNRGQRPRRFAGPVEQIVGDRTDHAAFEAQLQAAGPFDCVIDMICFRPEEAASLLRAARGRAAQVIFCSTVDVYAKPAPALPYREDTLRRPLNAYGEGKRACEDLLLEANARGEIAATIIRPAFTYGEGGGIVQTWGWGTTYIDRIRKGKPLIVHGDGNSLWSACHVDDAARAFVGAIGNRRAYGRAYHVTGEEWLTWNGYYEGVAEALNAPPPTLVHIPTDLLYRLAPQRARVLVDNFQFNNIFDTTAARFDLGFRYTVSWVAGVSRTVAWLDGHGGVANSDEDPFDDRLIAAWEKMINSSIQPNPAG